MSFKATLLSICIIFGLSTSAQAKVFLKVEEALAQSFPAARHCKTEPQSKVLTADQMKKASELAGSPIPSALVVRYVATCDGKPAGIAYTDTHRVRTHPETLLIVVGPKASVERVEVLSFDEPLDYIPREQWYGTFKNKKLDPELQIKKAIPFVTGASLTSRATTDAVRRALALDQVLGSTHP
jgi:Na+-translocating ferredoxin:NAD+ oxidoreductase RnfG subunit